MPVWSLEVQMNEADSPSQEPGGSFFNPGGSDKHFDFVFFIKMMVGHMDDSNRLPAADGQN